ncbi:helix-turn-helix domain-containing protein [Actinomadura atramentaria]|uniref:helix-turn-helix domain-containing protein n=1 Tax=Actinomadura atramentaria TaxID=1990 RepID=UPI00036D9516|nr:helix-turn-helix domain-containing protein [Actinomadura atramentaria]
MLPHEHPLLTAREVAALFAVSSGTVLNWAKSGLIPSIVLPSGHRRFPATAIVAILTSQDGHAEE